MFTPAHGLATALLKIQASSTAWQAASELVLNGNTLTVHFSEQAPELCVYYAMECFKNLNV